MAVSITEKELLQYVALMNEQQKKSLLEMIKVFVNAPGHETSVVTVKEYKRELEKAEAEFESGEYITHDELLQ